MTPTNIFIVEDEKIIAKGIEKRLKGLGYAIAGSASTAEEAIQRATEFRPDIILMDIHLGHGMDGVEAAGLIRSRLDVPVVYLTAHSDDATLQRAKLTEPFGYVLKPYEDKDLQTAIEIGLYKHKMERRLRDNEQWLAATLGSIGDGVIATDERGRVRFLNSVAEQLTGWTPADALGTGVREVFHVLQETTRQPVPNPALEALAKGEGVYLPNNTILIDKGGVERPIEDCAAPIRDVNGQLAGAVLVFRDITERRRLEEYLRQAQKMEAIGQLAGGVAHDFNNLLTAITGYCQLLLAGLSPHDTSRGFVQQVYRAGDRAADLTRQLLAYSRRQIHQPKVLNLNDLVATFETMLRRLIGEDIELVTTLAPDLAQIKVNPGQVEQVLMNLAVNARDAMPQGGRLTIETSAVQMDGALLDEFAEIHPGPHVLLAITDTGCGMDRETQAHIFEPFCTTKEQGKGTGLGLATVYGIVMQSGGQIKVYSEPGLGTTFKILLPGHAEAVRPERSRPAAADALLGTETLLLAEDEPHVRSLVLLALQRCGYTVLEASNGVEALEVASQHQQPIDLLVTDVVMPQMGGRQLAEALRHVRPQTKVLFLSGYTEDAVVRHGILEAETAFLQKPFTMTALAQKVREVLDDKVESPPTEAACHSVQ